MSLQWVLLEISWIEAVSCDTPRICVKVLSKLDNRRVEGMVKRESFWCFMERWVYVHGGHLPVVTGVK